MKSARRIPPLPSLRFGVAALLFGFSLLQGCGQSKRDFDEVEPVQFEPDAGPQPVECSHRCSRDLKKVLCDDAVALECNPDQGCGDGKCVDACTAAEMSKGSVGCAFATLPPDETSMADSQLGESWGSCFAAVISNTWDRPVTISAALGAEPLDVTRSTYTVDNSGGTTKYTLLDGPLPAEQVAIVFLSQSTHEGRSAGHIGCPAGTEPAYKDDPILHGSGKTQAFRLTTDAPVSAYSVYPYGGASSYKPTSTLLLPLSSWDTNYVAMTSFTAGSTSAGGGGRQVLQIVAQHDGTEVRLHVPGAGNASEHWTLNHNEVAQVTEGIELGGSFIEADKPIGLFGGSECTVIGGVPACDVLQQQIPALSQWGNEYALVPFRPRTMLPGVDDDATRENVPWRLVGAAAGTVLTYDPEPPGGAPLTLEPGEVASFMTTKLVTVKSQDAAHPFLASVFMTGARFNNSTATLGDPDFVTVVPTDQFLDRYIFFADYTYPETTLTVVRRKTGTTSTGFAPVSLGCGGEITNFRPLGAAGNYEYAWVHQTSDFVPQPLSGGSCGYGRNEIHSDGPFSLTVWGTGYTASYGYNGGTGSRPLNDVRAPVVN